MDHLVTASAPNRTSLLIPSSKDLIMALPRALSRIGSFAFITMPEHIDGLLNQRHSGSIIASATGKSGNDTTASAALSVMSSLKTAAATADEGTMPKITPAGLMGHTFIFGKTGKFGGIFTYITGKWALSWFALLVVLNRVFVYASPRRPLNLGFPLRLALRIIPILLFSFHAKNILEAIKCQTSPHYSQLMYGSSDKRTYLDFGEDGGLLYYLSSALLFWQNDLDSCRAVDMIQATPAPDLLSRKGSFSLLWPLFQAMCFGQFIDALSCAIQGRRPMVETVMSVFEYSLACTEAEGMVSNRFGISGHSEGNSEAFRMASSSALLGSLNTSPEVLLMGLIQSLSHLTSHVLGALDLQSSFRLINTGFWGLCHMTSFVLGFKNTLDAGADTTRFPTICVIGFIPQFLICIGIGICACIYALAIILSLFSPPSAMPTPVTFIDRFKIAHRNLQANAPLSRVRLEMNMDFYNALMRVGLAAMIVAHKALYLNEKRAITVSRLTWLEEERMQELEASHQSLDKTSQDLRAQAVTEEVTLRETDGLTPTIYRSAKTSGYAREATTESLTSNRSLSGYRYVMIRFFTGIFLLMMRFLALVLVRVRDAVGFSQVPRWFSSSNDRPHPSKAPEGALEPDSDPSRMLLNLSLVDHEDVEAEIKRGLADATDHWGEDEERKLDSMIYNWWAHGPTWGERDESGTYQATEEGEDDSTSVISASNDNSESDWEEENDHVLGPSQLARLLAPTDPAERQESEILAHHLTSDRIVTRSTYRRARVLERARVLTSTRYGPAASLNLTSSKLTDQEEETVLEQLLFSRRHRHNDASSSPPIGSSSAQTWQNGAEGLGAGGPQCVVCQNSPRTILVWPCRCLSLCEECRLSLAVNDFGTCVCCRQRVYGYSRLFVP